MKPLETRALKEAKEKRNKTIIGIVIAAIMVFSTIGFVLWQRPDEEQDESLKKYNSYTFTKVEQGWMAETAVSGEKIYLTTVYFPQEVENITSGKLFLSDFADKDIYIIANSLGERQAAGELASALENFVHRMQFACSIEEENDSFCIDNNLPIKSCEDAGQQNAVIFFDDSGNETSINFYNGCLTIKGQDTELIKAADKSIFIIFGIMK